MSNSAEISDSDGLRDWYDGEVTVYAETGIHIEDHEQFTEELSQFLEEPIEITTVSFVEGHVTSGTEWTIHPDGSTESTHIGQ